MDAVLTALGTMGAIALAGWLLGRSGALGPTAQAVLARFVFLVATPALLFTTIGRAELSLLLTRGALVTATSTALVAVLAALTFRLVLRRDGADATVGTLAASYLNAAFVGIPLAVYVLGDALVVVPTIMVQLLVLAPVAFTVLAARLPGAVRGVRGVVGRTLRNPIILAVLAGVVLAAVPGDLPEVVVAPLEMVGGTAAPLALVAFGLSTATAGRAGPAGDVPRTDDGDGAERVERADLAVVVVARTVAHPLITAAVGRALGLSDETLLAVVTMAALPTAQNVLVYAMQYGRRTGLARRSVLVTTLLAVPVLLVVTAALH